MPVRPKGRKRRARNHQPARTASPADVFRVWAPLSDPAIDLEKSDMDRYLRTLDTSHLHADGEPLEFDIHACKGALSRKADLMAEGTVAAVGKGFVTSSLRIKALYYAFYDVCGEVVDEEREEEVDKDYMFEVGGYIHLLTEGLPADPEEGEEEVGKS